ncbi:alpha/beta hydrolase [Microbacterium sp. ASV81]|uniref:Alpha/beta hydrolase-fold protein n=1 Tax=Microbacterium capsulatum TaxID=3041921 RepID=A0ABU0XKI1_9MICO|nr:alpha/beta hydrolase-fold protein [Microbacterium sp. ASV81]MDQ4215650.1 alpha/beta hydrolase-fold protein [Microbacterium sp. ASV81]
MPSRSSSARILVGGVVGLLLIGLAGFAAAPRADGPEQAAAILPDNPLYDSWHAPAGMPAHGEVTLLAGDDRIPSSAGFEPRDASLYLPPAALVTDPPDLPLVVFMMGQPGDPDPEPISTAMDELAAQHDGLAPIVIVADQLGDPSNNPACVDSGTFGGVETYFTKDIPAWAREHLHVAADPSQWTIAGFSNGGGCALDWALGHPGLWGNVVSLSGESYQGTEFPDEMLQQVFDGDQAAYEAAKPAARAEKHAGQFTGHLAIFAAGADDAEFSAQAQLSRQIAKDAGFDTRFFSIPGEDHVGALPGGLLVGFEALFPRLGLGPPSH